MHIESTSNYKLQTNISLPDILVEKVLEMPDLQYLLKILKFVLSDSIDCK